MLVVFFKDACFVYGRKKVSSLISFMGNEGVLERERSIHQ